MLAPLKLAIGQSHLAWRAYPQARREIHQVPPGPPILVTGMYRSGTTWVGAMLAAPGVWHLHEPFNPNLGLWSEELAYRRSSEPDRRVDALVKDLVHGRHRKALKLPHAHRFFLPMRVLPLRPQRILIKDPSAALLSEYLTRRHGMRTLVLFRHPLGVVASFVRLGWPTGTMATSLLRNEVLMEDWLHPFARAMELAIGRRDWYSGAVLYACVARVLSGFIERSSGAMRPLPFEEICLDPIGRFRQLYRDFDLPYAPGVRAMHESLCLDDRRRHADHLPYEVRRSSEAMAWAWRDEVSEHAVTTVQEVWRDLGVPLYQDPALWWGGQNGEGARGRWGPTS